MPDGSGWLPVTLLRVFLEQSINNEKNGSPGRKYYDTVH